MVSRRIFLAVLISACGKAGDRDARELARLDPVEAAVRVRGMVDGCAGLERALDRLAASGLSGRTLSGLVDDAVDASRTPCPQPAIRGGAATHRLARARLADERPAEAYTVLGGDGVAAAIRLDPALRLRRAELLDRLGRPADALGELDALVRGRASGAPSDPHALDLDDQTAALRRALEVSVAVRSGRPADAARAIAAAPLPEQPALAYRAAADAPPALLDALAAAGAPAAPPSNPGAAGAPAAPPSNPGGAGAPAAPPSNPGAAGAPAAPPSNPGAAGAPAAPPSNPGAAGAPAAPPSNPGAAGAPAAPPSNPGAAGAPAVPPSNPGAAGAIAELAAAVADRIERERDPAAALAARERAAAAAPERAEHHDALARARLDAGAIDAAIAAWDRAIALAPAQPAYRLAPITALIGADALASRAAVVLHASPWYRTARDRVAALAAEARAGGDVELVHTASLAAATIADRALAVALAREAQDRRPGDGRFAFAIAERLAEAGDRSAAATAFADLLACGAHGRPWHRHEVAAKLVGLATDPASSELVVAALAAARPCTVEAADLATYVDAALTRLR